MLALAVTQAIGAAESRSSFPNIYTFGHMDPFAAANWPNVRYVLFTLLLKAYASYVYAYVTHFNTCAHGCLPSAIKPLEIFRPCNGRVYIVNAA